MTTVDVSGLVIDSVPLVVVVSDEVGLSSDSFVTVDFDGDTDEIIGRTDGGVAGVRSAMEGRREMDFWDELVAAKGRRVAVPIPVAVAVDGMVGMVANTGVEVGEDDADEDASDSPLDDRVM